MAYPNLANGWISTLSAGINSTDLSCTVPSTSGLPALPTKAVILAEGANSDEIITISANAAGTLTIARAVEANASGSTAASAHAAGATIAHVLTAQALADLYAAAVGRVYSIVAVFDGGGSAITGNPEVDVVCPAAGTLTGWTILGDVSGSAVVDVWKDTYANYPPTVADTIAASAKPTLSTATKNQDSTLTGWTTSISAGDIVRFHVDSASTVKRLTVALTYVRS